MLAGTARIMVVGRELDDAARALGEAVDPVQGAAEGLERRPSARAVVIGDAPYAIERSAE